jgi:hypothetical protein
MYVSLSGSTTEDIANFVNCDFKVEAAHLFNDEVASGFVFVRQRKATDPTIGNGADLGQLTDPLLKAVRIHMLGLCIAHRATPCPPTIAR